MLNRPPEILRSQVHELRSMPTETERVEFKANRAEPQQVGRYVSALANAAALHGKTRGYILWGVDDSTRSR